MSKESSPNENEDDLGKEAFAKIDEQSGRLHKASFQILEDAKKVFAKCNDKSHVASILLARDIPGAAFGSRLHESELGLHKAERLTNGTATLCQ